ncbi:PepSY domain-containing protein [Hymenobacter aerilatus]|uniref:PepSY domain-containing protein n=1 Tax=Hymenobacter aerilatus TaxID=2932251 RepID=A0A8T9STS4_9BACT|nr:PepSY-associated TM helix domain-containing protein [Hymenobacter aerilatus]UOR05538.1 PepSY domain-containing protein [Hymenobacter aerilatus]
MTFKKLVGKLHFWLGLSSGLVVLIVALTGCIYVFQKELFDVLHQDLVRVEAPAQAQPLPLSVVWSKAQEALGPDKPLQNGTTYADPTRAWTFMTYKGNAGQPYFGNMIEYHRTVYVNPYTGQVNGVLDNKYEFFQVVKWLHWGLWLGTAGEYIVGWSTLIFVFLLLSGLVLWWPKNKAARKQRFTVKWNATRKRLNYDLHNTVGFYLALVALIIALTGLTWSFNWVKQGITYLATGQTELPGGRGGKGSKGGKEGAKPDLPLAAQLAPPLTAVDAALRDAWQRLPQAKAISTGKPTPDQPITLRSALGNKRFQSGQLTYTAAGQFEKVETYRDKPKGELLVMMNYDIHVGSALGMPGKIIAFLASLLIATLPVTGFYIWWGKRRKQPTKHRPATVGTLVERRRVARPVRPAYATSSKVPASAEA